MRHVLALFITAVFGLMAVRSASGQHVGDIFVGIEGEQLVTGVIESDQSITTPVRVFGATFGDSGCPPFTANPGFDALPGTFTVGAENGWNALAGFQMWNGAGFDAVDDSFLEASFGSQQFSVNDEPVDGFDLFVQPNGGFHVHLDFCMNGCPEVCSPPNNVEPGIYLVQLEMYSTDPNLASSDPFWLVFNYLDSAENQQAAINWVQRNLVDTGSTCSGDFNDDQCVDVPDLLSLLGQWGACSACPEDLDASGAVDVEDLLMLLGSWGACE